MNESLPEIKLGHLKRMTDSFALIQHCTLCEPDLETGYTLDDNSRALIAMLEMNELCHSEEALLLSAKYSQFMEFAQIDGGWMHNFFSIEKKPLDRGGSSDSFGRAILACGTAISCKWTPTTIREQCRRIFENAKPHINGLMDARAVSYALRGLCRLIESREVGKEEKKLARILSQRLTSLFKENSINGWRWFEPQLTYSNAAMPMALFDAGRALKKKELKRIAEESFAFLEKKTIFNGKLVLIGQHGWLHKGGKRSYYDQQPVDAGEMVEACEAAHRATGKKHYLDSAKTSFEWFMGKNSSGHKMYLKRNGGCYDGLCKDGVNLNQGAESTLAYLSARIAMERLNKR